MAEMMAEAVETMQVRVTVNGKLYEREVEPRMLLVEFLRDELGLTGTHVGCETTYCGACTVLLGGVTVKSCTLFVAQAHECEILTVEGLAKERQLHPLQQAFSECHGLQCGFCTPGLLMSSYYLLSTTPNPTEEEIRKAIAGNVCRCTGYQNVIKSIQLAARTLSGDR